MPRQARIDASGALHHIIVRGIERCKIFKNDADRESFVERFGKIMGDTAHWFSARCMVKEYIKKFYIKALKEV